MGHVRRIDPLEYYEAVLKYPDAHDLVEHPLHLRRGLILALIIVVDHIRCIVKVLGLLGLCLLLLMRCGFMSFQLLNLELEFVSKK